MRKNQITPFPPKETKQMPEEPGGSATTLPAELRFLRDAFVAGGDAFWGLPGSMRPDGRYSVQSSKLAARYNAWRASLGLVPVGCGSLSRRMVAHGAPFGIERVRGRECRYFRIDVPRLCAALGADAPCADFQRCALI